MPRNKTRMQTSQRSLHSVLSKADSNHHKQNQNLLCYHYTIGQRLCFAAAKVGKIWHTAKFFPHFSLFNPSLMLSQ